MTLKSLLTLCRIPNVFTAAANVVAGVVLARGGGFEVDDLRLVAASAMLYIAGMVLNDYFDRAIDARERPERPIPSGAVSAATAALLGFGLLGGGVAAASSHSAQGGAVAAILALCVVLYDAGLKSTLLAPVSMGACRFVNVTLGFAAAPWPDDWRWTAPAIMGLYTAVITYLSRDEVEGGAGDRCRSAAAMMAVLFATLAIALTTASPAVAISRFALVAPFLVILAVRGYSLFSPLRSDSTPPVIGRAIGGGILLMPVIDAASVAAAGHDAAAALVACLALPALLTKRWFYMT